MPPVVEPFAILLYLHKLKGPHAAGAYLKAGRTIEMYVALFTCLVHLLRLRLSKPSTFDAIASVASVWVCQDLSLLKCTRLSTTSTMCLFDCLSKRLLKLILMTWHFAG